MLSVILHGGAGHFFPNRTTLKLPYLKLALDAAWHELIQGKSGEYAVAAALHVMEECQYFNAGYGGYPNEHGIVLLDVGLMCGKSGKFVSIINARRFKYPSVVALDMLHERKSSIMTIWTHELMTKLDNADSAEKERVGWVSSHEEMIAPYTKEIQEISDNTVPDCTHGTVGCVVRDAEGNLYSGTSTGGINMKENGRVGDSPIISGGVYADNNIGALSTTGNGEAILGCCLSGFILSDMRADLSRNPHIYETTDTLQSRLDKEIKNIPLKYPGKSGAIIVMPPQGLPKYALAGENISVASRSGSAEKIEEEYVMIERGNGKRITL